MDLNGIPIHVKNDSNEVLNHMSRKDEKSLDAFKLVVKNMIDSQLTFKEINDVLYNANEFLYRKMLEQKIPAKNQEKA